MNAEYAELELAYKKEKNRKVADRIGVVCQVLIDGDSITSVAKRFRVAYNTVKNYIKRYKARGIAGLHDAARSGRPPKYRNESLLKYIGDSSAGVHPEYLRDSLKKDHDVVYTKSGMTAALRRIRFSPKRPQPVHNRRASLESALVWQHGMAERLENLKKDRIPLLVIDQHLIRHDYKSRRGWWSAIGVPIWRKYYGRHSQSITFGGITTSKQRIFQNIGEYNAEGVLNVIKDAHKMMPQFELVWDRAPQHMSNSVLEHIMDQGGDIQLSWFPTGWPELNPVEICWGIVERNPVMNQQFTTVEKRMNAIMNVLNTCKLNVDIEKVMVKQELVQKEPGNTMYAKLEYEKCKRTIEPPFAKTF